MTYPDAFKAMNFALHMHRDQHRKYTGAAYREHLAEVAGITATVLPTPTAISTAWLHDVVEDQGVKEDQLIYMFGSEVACGVMLLSDLEVGNRATRKAASCVRLGGAPGWVQTIKCADLISNTRSIKRHDPDFAKVYFKEKAILLEHLDRADKRLLGAAWALIKEETDAV